MFRIGIGYDIHRFKAGRKLVLGGVRVPSGRGLDGHSDADVVLHAVCDALLGALGAPDIGEQFPDTRKIYKNISSVLLLEKVYQKMAAAGYRAGNVDVMLLLETPKISAYKDKMRRLIARTLHIDKSRVGLKATTNEGVGPIGRGEAAAAQAVALIARI